MNDSVNENQNALTKTTRNKRPSGDEVSGLLMCGKCSRTFNTQGALNGHQRSHSFFHFIETLRAPEEREKERKDAHDSIVIAAINHFSYNYTKTGTAPHCDVCATVKVKVDGPLMRDLLAWLDTAT